ncbi:hypothetical protein SAMN02745181_3540 [Rubritalea squalenifaciens DSM 18772]|uniref:Uncharacterized protein n=1 Tax=Rubritalea squalenifaciens DSM 18772 TaxID=1123071 RepID=A0A1M6R3X7_9BACT|nr:hypothetical protein [Rubritalea squalenifaciens]SHK27152.1 hypothetical protein SAMN02745181_3540 [Rubritalea squalenifaciens DSM 18772]
MSLHKSFTLSLQLVSLLVIGVSSLTNAEPAQPTQRKKPKIAEKVNIYKVSAILVSSSKHTVVPEKAILYTPDALKSKVAKKPEGEFVKWSSFYKSNYSWLHLMEVSLEQARGLKPIDKTKIENLQRQGKMIIAVYKKNPITVTPYKEKESEETKEANQ